MSGSGSRNTQRRPDRAALGIAAALAAVAVIIAWSTLQAGGVASYSPVGPKTFPYIIAGGLFILSILTAVEAARGHFPQRETQDFPPMLWVLAGLVAQMLTMKTIGFSLSTGLLFAATARAFGKREFWKTFPVGVVFALLVWLMFAKGLQLTLPAGLLERLF
ncbi:tripartite tricarboxylate transporter TctB family protein [Aquamicrobium ahrensii]|uniref:Tricarboxylic transport membrane protein n=1 Tax=Aquamicrobium ahrensii TaxID=469551 RepID=A0ABV2KIX2_9HYPH